MAAPGITTAVVTLSVLVSLDVAAQDWPTRAITLVNPVAAGGSNEQVKSIILDRVAGSMRHTLAHATGWPVIAERTELLVCFGGIPLKNTDVTPGGVTQALAPGFTAYIGLEWLL